MKRILAFLVLCCASASALDISLTPWQRVQSSKKILYPAYLVNGVLVGGADRPDFGDTFFSVDAGLSVVLTNGIDNVAYRGDGLFQVSTNLYRVAANGRLVHSGSSCPTLSRAATARNGAILVSVLRNIVGVSTDGGVQWTEYLNPWGPIGSSKLNVNEVYYDGTSFVAVAVATWLSNGQTLRSVDGITWQFVADKAVRPLFTGELGLVESSKLYLLRETLEAVADDVYGHSIAIVQGGFYAWSDSTLRFYGDSSTAVETTMPYSVMGVFPHSDGRLRVFTTSTGAFYQPVQQTWDSLPLAQSTTSPAINAIAMAARLALSGTPNATLSIEGSSSANGPWQQVGSAALNFSGHGVWTDPSPANRTGWFYRVADR